MTYFIYSTHIITADIFTKLYNKSLGADFTSLKCNLEESGAKQTYPGQHKRNLEEPGKGNHPLLDDT